MMVPQAVYPARHAQPVGRIFPLDIGFLTSNLMISAPQQNSWVEVTADEEPMV
jgi:hypothetical protein